MEAYEILKRPIITEKATAQHEKSIYTFEVPKKVNKLQIRKAVEDQYGVTVTEVRTSISRGKTVVRQTKKGVASGIKGSYKKAVVQLANNDVIDIFGNAGAETE